MFKKKEIISAFDIEGGLVKLAQISIEDSGRFLYRLATQKTQRENKDSLVKAIRRLAGEYKIAETRVMVNLPRHKVTVKNLKLPAVNPSEIENMVSLQAAKQLPFLPDKIISGYKILERDKNGYSNVMVVLAQRDIIDNILKIFNKAGLDVERLSLSSETLGLWYIEKQKEDEKGACVCLVDIGRSVLEIEIIKGGKLDFTRSVSFLSPGDMEGRIVDETRKTLFTYKKTGSGPDITKLVLTGKRSIINREAPILKKNLELPTVYIDTLKPWPQKDVEILPSKETLSNETFTAVLSLGFNFDKLETNLIPPEIRLKKISKIIKERLVMSVALLLSVSLGIGGIATKNFIDKKRFLTSINERLEETKPQVEKLTRFKEITYVVKRQLDIKGSCVDIIRELYSKIPPEIFLTILDYEDGRTCLLRGRAQRLSDVFKFVSTLEDSPYFENVKVRYASKRIVEKKEVTDFEIICQLTRIQTDVKR